MQDRRRGRRCPRRPQVVGRDEARSCRGRPARRSPRRTRRRARRRRGPASGRRAAAARARGRARARASPRPSGPSTAGRTAGRAGTSKRSSRSRTAASSQRAWSRPQKAESCARRQLRRRVRLLRARSRRAPSGGRASARGPGRRGARAPLAGGCWPSSSAGARTCRRRCGRAARTREPARHGEATSVEDERPAVADRQASHLDDGAAASAARRTARSSPRPPFASGLAVRPGRAAAPRPPRRASRRGSRRATRSARRASRSARPVSPAGIAGGRSATNVPSPRRVSSTPASTSRWYALADRVRVDALLAREVAHRGQRVSRPQRAGGHEVPHAVLDLAPDRHRQRRVDPDARLGGRGLMLYQCTSTAVRCQGRHSGSGC